MGGRTAAQSSPPQVRFHGHDAFINRIIWIYHAIGQPRTPVLAADKCSYLVGFVWDPHTFPLSSRYAPTPTLTFFSNVSCIGLQRQGFHTRVRSPRRSPGCVTKEAGRSTHLLIGLSESKDSIRRTHRDVSPRGHHSNTALSHWGRQRTRKGDTTTQHHNFPEIRRRLGPRSTHSQANRHT